MTDRSVVRTDRLKSLYGDWVVLTNEHGDTEPYRIMAEFQLDGRTYAALQNKELRKEDEVHLFAVLQGPEGEPQLESIDDEAEWERVAEAYDELVFAQFDADDDFSTAGK
jgi:uncharacterized protein YrzB (UPF0473 family)